MRILSAICFLLLGTLSLAAQTACIEGRVLDTNGVPIPDIPIIGIGARWAKFSAGTDRDGRFRVANLTAGNYGIATGEEFRADFFKIRVADAKDIKEVALVTVTAIVDGCSSVTLHRPQRARIHLLAKDALTAEDVSTAKAVFRYNAQTSWTKNRYNEQDLIVPPLMEFQLQAGALGYEDSPIMTIPALEPGETRELPLSLRPLQRGCISGQVVDQLGSPVGGVSVYADLAGDLMHGRIGYKTTDKIGQFRFEGMHPGEYSIGTDAMRLGYSGIPGHENDVSIIVESSAGCKDITINLGPKGAKIELKVVDAQTQRPLTESEAFVSGALADGGTWFQKFYATTMLVPALKSLNVTAGKNGYRDSEKVAVGPLQPEETRQITIELYPSTSALTKSQR
jgi:protocatechuate 3,4-dioxygenase beta subunit